MRLLAFDFSSLILRYVHINLETAAQGTMNRILDLTREVNPTHVLIASDSPTTEGFRREISPAYKADRKRADDGIKRQIDLAHRAAELIGFHVAQVPRYEADDVLASAADKFQGDVTIVTSDKDLLAACADNVTVRLIRNGGVHIDCGPAECEEIMGLPPSQITDFKAIAGDRSDGIPGVRGVGKAKAIPLLKHYGSLDAILDAARSGEQLEGVGASVTEKFRAGADEALLCRKLARLVTSLNLDFNACALPPPPDMFRAGQLEDLGMVKITGKARSVLTR